MDALSICIFLHKRLFYVFMQFMDAPIVLLTLIKCRIDSSSLLNYAQFGTILSSLLLNFVLSPDGLICVCSEYVKIIGIILSYIDYLYGIMKDFSRFQHMGDPL